MFTGAKVGDLMKIAMDAKDAKEWFGAPPPDLTVIARSRASGAGSGADWLYTYLRSFYRDPSRPTGWNNTVFPNVGMPHVLWQLQGEQVLKTEVQTIPVGSQGDVEKREVQKLVLGKPGAMKPAEYDRTGGRPGEYPGLHGRARRGSPASSSASTCCCFSACCSCSPTC